MFTSQEFLLEVWPTTSSRLMTMLSVENKYDLWMYYATDLKDCSLRREGLLRLCLIFGLRDLRTFVRALSQMGFAERMSSYPKM